MKISLTQGKFAIVDPEDYAFLMRWKWCYSNYGYAVRTDNVNKQEIRMHHIILERIGYKNFVKSDHKDRNRLNNRRYNLRPATDSQSNCNRNKRRNNISGYKGVCWHKRNKKWYTRIQVNKKCIFLGLYNDPKEAAQAYNKAAHKYHGKFVVLNRV